LILSCIIPNTLKIVSAASLALKRSAFKLRRGHKNSQWITRQWNKN